METPHKPDFKFTSQPSSDKERKSLMILELIRKKGPISRSDISKITDINIVSISNYIKDYINKRIVLEKGLDISSGGRRPELVELNSEGLYIVGVDIGPSELMATMTDLGMDVVKKLKAPRPKGGKKEVIDKSIDLIQELIRMSKIEVGKINAIGLGISDVDLISAKSTIEARFGIESFAGSDAACAAFGEKQLNPQADVGNLLYMHSDVGCGIIVRKDIYFGAKEGEGIFLKESQYLRPWNAYLSIDQTAKREIEKGIGTKMVDLAGGEINNVTQEVVIEASRQNDEVALNIIENTGMNLGIRIAYLVNLFSPEIVIIGGGIERAGEFILGPIRKMVKRFAFSENANRIKIIPSVLGEAAVSLGAAALAIREIFLRA